MTDSKLRAGLCFAYFFLVMASYYVMKPVREALFLHSQGFRSVPLIHILVCLVTFVAAAGYEALARRVRGGRLVTACQPALALSVLGFWACLRFSAGQFSEWLPWIFYLGVALFSAFAVALFWSLTHSVFTPEESRTHYGLINAGGIAGGAVGALVTGRYAGQIGSDNLLLVAAVFILLCWGLAQKLDGMRLLASEPENRTEPGSPKNDSYILAIGALVLVSMVVAELGDNQSQRVLSGAHLSRDALTSFFGLLYSRVNLLGLTISFFLTRPLEGRFGPGPGLLLLPIAAVVEAVFMAQNPSVDILSLILIFDLAVQYSIFQSSKELLYNPTSPEVKFRAKAFIDTFVYRLGIAAGAFLMLLVLPQASLQTVSAVAIGLAAVTAGLVLFLQRAYRGLFPRPSV